MTETYRTELLEVTLDVLYGRRSWQSAYKYLFRPGNHLKQAKGVVLVIKLHAVTVLMYCRPLIYIFRKGTEFLNAKQLSGRKNSFHLMEWIKYTRNIIY